MKRMIIETDEAYTDQDMIELINQAARSRDQAIYKLAEEAMYDVMEVGDQIVLQESDGNMYPYTLESKSNYYKNNRMEFSARLSSELAYETGGYVKTCNILGQIIYNIKNDRKWYLDLKR